MEIKNEGVREFLRKRRSNPKQRDFFNDRAAVWDKMTVHDLEKVERITGLLGLKGHERILDVGTGTGVMIPFYESRLTSGEVMAIDYSEKMIEQARGKFPESDHPLVSYRVMDIYEADFGPEFDVVVCYSCFPHFPDPVGAIRVLSGCLRPGGRLVIAHSSSKEHINRVHEEGGDEISADFLPMMEVMRAMMSEAGLTTSFEQDDQDYYVIIADKL